MSGLPQGGKDMLREWISSCRLRLRALFEWRELDRDLDDELQFHLAMRAQKLVEQGMSPEEAHYAARRGFGNVLLLKETNRDMWGFRSLETFFQDARYALRIFGKSPGFTVVVVLTLALGIGANTSIFTLIDAVMLKSLPLQRPEQLVLFSDDASTGVVSGQTWKGNFSYFSYPFYKFLRDHYHSFQSLCAIQHGSQTLWVRVAGGSAAEPPQQVRGQLVSGTYFKVLGIHAILGRTLTVEDDTPSAHPAAVIGYAYWKKQFHEDPNVLGKVVDVNGTPFSIVGVTPAEFFGETVGPAPGFWLPLVAQPRVMQRESWLDRQDVYWLNMVGRLKPGVSIRQAQAEVNLGLHQFLTALAGTKISDDLRGQIEQSYVQLKPGARGISQLRLTYSQSLHLLMGIVALVLLIACANVANLLLSRAIVRQREISVRLILGAGRARVTRQLLTESLLLAVLGGALGMVSARWGVKILLVLAGIHYDLDIKPDALVLSFTVFVSLFTGALFGLAPTIRACKVDLVSALKAPTGLGIRSKLSMARGLVVFQVALSLLLLVAASLLARSLVELTTQTPGFQEDNVLVARVDPRVAGYQASQLPVLYRRMLDQLKALPGVRAASLAAYTPMSGSTETGNFSIEGLSAESEKDSSIFMEFVGPDYFGSIGTRLLLGRGIGWQDTQASPKVAVVNESLVRDFFPNQNPIGRRISPGSPFRRPGYEIVGVAEDAKYYDLGERPPRMVYYAVLQANGESAYARDVLIRTSGNPDGAAAEMRHALDEVDGKLPVVRVSTLRTQVEDTLQQQRLIMELSSFFGLLALLLSCVGLYGIMSYGVTRRAHEIGIRMAIGAQRSSITWMVLKDMLSLLGIGIGIGLAASLAAARLIASFLFGVTATDPITIAFSVALLLAVAALASYLPTRRASRVDPMVALRYE